MTERRLPMELHHELARDRMTAARHRQVSALRRRRRAVRWERAEGRLQDLFDRVARRRAPEVCCA